MLIAMPGYTATIAWASLRSVDPAYTQRYGGDTFSVFSWCWYQALAQAAVNPDAYVFTRSEVTSFNPRSAWS
jgi:hypothetical protein